MALGWVNYLSIVVGIFVAVSSATITIIVLKRNPKEKLNWLFSMSFFFIAIAYFFLPVGGLVLVEGNPEPMILLTKIYALSLFLGIVILALSSLVFNYGIQFVGRWQIVTIVVIAIGIVGGLLFGLNDSEGPWYSVRQAPTGGADVQTSLIFATIFYPICLLFVTTAIVFFIKAFRQTKDKNVRKSLKYFIFGLCVNIGSILPNFLSNILADYWADAQILNGLEFIMVAIGISLMLTGFLVVPTPEIVEVVEETYKVPVA